MVREGVVMCGERRNDLVSNKSAVFINVVCLALSCFHILTVASSDFEAAIE